MWRVVKRANTWMYIFSASASHLKMSNSVKTVKICTPILTAPELKGSWLPVLLAILSSDGRQTTRCLIVLIFFCANTVRRADTHQWWNEHGLTSLTNQFCFFSFFPRVGNRLYRLSKHFPSFNLLTKSSRKRWHTMNNRSLVSYSTLLALRRYMT